MSLDTWYTVAQIAGVVLVALTFAAAAIAFGTGYFVNKKKDAQIRQHEERIASAGTEIAQLNVKANALNAEAERAKADREEASRQIEVAKADAAKAKQKTEELEQQNIGLRTDLQNAEARASVERQKVANLERETAEARRKQAEAEQALLELQERLKRRHLDANQQAVFLQTLRAHPAGTVELEFNTSDDEIEDFAMQLRDLLQAAGWTVEFMPAVAGGTWRGIVIGIPYLENPSIPALALAQAFANVGFQPQGQGWNMPEGRIKLIIGAKPQR